MKTKKANAKSKTRMKRSGQIAFLPNSGDIFMGLKRGTHAKTKRPLTSQKPLHVCFRSKFAKGKRTMLGINKLKVNKLVAVVSNRFGIRILKFANAGNHLHLVVRLPGKGQTSKLLYAKWIRLLTSRIAFEIGKSKKGEPFFDEKGERAKFWDAIPFSRVVHGFRGWKTIDQYILKNRLEAQGIQKDAACEMAKELYDSSQVHELPDWLEEKDWLERS